MDLPPCRRRVTAAARPPGHRDHDQDQEQEEEQEHEQEQEQEHEQDHQQEQQPHQEQEQEHEQERGGVSDRKIKSTKIDAHSVRAKYDHSSHCSAMRRVIP